MSLPAVALLALAQFPVPVFEGPVHLGDNETKELTPAKPHGVTWSVAFHVPRPARRHVLVLEARHVVHVGHAGYRKGDYRDRVFVNDTGVGLLNESIEKETYEPARVELAVPEGVVRAGSNTLRIEAGLATDERGRKNHDDFSIAKGRLWAAEPVVVRPREKGVPAGAAPYPITLDFEALDQAGDPILGPSFRAAGARSVAIDVSGETRCFLRAPGRFRVWALRGMEWSAASAEVSTERGPPAPVTLEIERLLDPPGMVGADFHLHSQGSPDSQVVFDDRVRACAAAGLEFVVATEHNNVVDLTPVIEKLGYAARIRATPGDEITTRDPNLGHFNFFPLVPDPSRPKNGAVPWERLKPGDLVAWAAARKGGGVLQINHPRYGDIGYFNRFQLAWKDGRRSALPDFSTDFDAVEVLNGQETGAKMREVLADWFRLLGDGLRLTATGNSDSHKIVFQEAGWPRNYVAVGTDDPARVDAAAVVAAVRARRVTVSHGPVVRVLVDDRDAVGAEVTAPGGELKLRVLVDAVPWVRVDRVEVVVNGAVAAREEVPASKEVRRLDRVFPLRLDRDSWVVVTAEGSGFDAPARLVHDLPPYAFTNPVWVRVGVR